MSNNKYLNTLSKYGMVQIDTPSKSDTFIPSTQLNARNDSTPMITSPEIIEVPEVNTKGTTVGAKFGETEMSFINPNTKFFYSLPAKDRPSFSHISTADDLGYRNNNPGNLRPYSGYSGKESNGFRVFGSLEAGWKALVHDFEIKQSGMSSVITPSDTVRKYISIYAPASENDTKAYIKYIQQNGIDIDKPINSLSHDETMHLLETIVKRESPNSYEYLFNPKVRNSVLSSLTQSRIPKSKYGRIIYNKY